MEFPHVVLKDWGREIWFANDREKNYCGKQLDFRLGWRCSLHRHLVKDEVFYVPHGSFKIEFSDEEDGSNLQLIVLSAGDRFHVPTRRWHRMTAIGARDGWASLIEVSTFHRDEDVERLEKSGQCPHLIHERRQ